ncbi:MAG: hypothetical protein IAF02_22625 [Anaerolineae bacterium]|nr:hypothetical protein [Anaerolineae bacterium]
MKTLLVVGSVAATLAGTRLLAVQDVAFETAVTEPEQIIIIESAPMTPLPMPPTTGSRGQTIVLDLAPIPQAVTPHINPVQVQQAQSVQQAQQTQPVAKTKSS